MQFLSWLLTALFSLSLFACAAPEPPTGDPGPVLGGIHVLNTGWEDAIVLESGGRYALIDAGEPGRGPYIVDYLQRLAGGDAVHLDFIIGTHSHVDHMGGFPYILDCPDITVGKAYTKRELKPDQTDEVDRGHYRNFIAGCENRGIEVVQDNLDGLELTLGNMKVTLLNGAPLAGGVSNPESLCQLVELGGMKALLAADMVSSDKELGVLKQVGGPVDFLKVGHHGMGDSTGFLFACMLRPKVAVYTNGSSWETDSHDVTLGVAKGAKSYHRLRMAGAVQYVTTDAGGILAVFGENGMAIRAIKEFTRKDLASIYELRGETVLRPAPPPDDFWTSLLNL